MEEKELNNTKIILEIINLFKESNYQKVIDVIKDKQIEADYSSEIISDYAALWLKEPEILDFFKEIRKLGGNPMWHPTIMQNCIKNNKFKAVKYLIKNGALEQCENDMVYFINGPILDNHINSIKELMKHVDFKKHVLKHEKLPSFLIEC